MKKLVFFFLSFCAFYSTGIAQEGIPVYFDYLSDNYYLVHPSMAGIGEGGKVRLTARKQWFNVDDAPNLQTFNAHFRVSESSGVGGILFNDANGYHSQTGVKFTYAHHLRFSRDVRNLNQLSFGLSPTILLSSLDETEFRSVQPDAAITGTKNTSAYYNVDIGMSYNFMEFYTHFSILNVLGTERSLYRVGRGGDVPVMDRLRRYVFTTGYVFGKGDWQIEPSVLFQMTDYSKAEAEELNATNFSQDKIVDINAKVYRDVPFGKVWGGLSYRRSLDSAVFATANGVGKQSLQLFTPIIGVNYNNFMFSYNYSYQYGDINYGNGGFHQITLGYDFGQDAENKYDCNCPAVNY